LLAFVMLGGTRIDTVLSQLNCVNQKRRRKHLFNKHLRRRCRLKRRARESNPQPAKPASDFESTTIHGKTRSVSIPGSKSAAVAAEIPQDLQALVVAWPALPEAIKAGILAMVKAAGGKPER